MNKMILKFQVKSQMLWSVLKNEEGQDLVEYALLVALIALAATVGMSGLAGSINNAFASVGSQLTNAVA